MHEQGGNTAGRGDHRDAPPRTLLGGPNQSWYGTRAHKYEVAAGKGAAAVLVVHEGEDAARTWSSIQAATTRESFEIRPRTATERVSIEGWIARPAFEAICDVTSPGRNPLVERAKDIAAGAVLLAALTAFAVALLVFGPRLAALLQA